MLIYGKWLQASKHTHTLNTVTLVWDSLRLAPILSCVNGYKLVGTLEHYITNCYFFYTLVIAINGATDQASFGQGNGPVFLSNVGCTGNESSLLNCSNQGIGVVYCLDFNDVGVICPSGTCKY